MIRFTFQYLKPVALLLAILGLFQCCKAYDLHTTSIDQAVGPQKKYVKVVVHDGEEILLDSIYYRNDKLYGLVKESEKVDSHEMELHEENILEVQIHVKNFEKSRRRTAILIAVPAFALITIGVLIAIAAASMSSIDL